MLLESRAESRGGGDRGGFLQGGPLKGNLEGESEPKVEA